MEFHIRAAQPEDLPAIMHLVRQLAIYEKLEHEMVATAEHFRQALFGSNPLAEALLAFAGGTPIGLAFYFRSFSTFLGRGNLYLEDIFVEPKYRGHGVGTALLRRLAAQAVQENLGRVEWSVLTWNQPSIDFYHHLGAVTMEDWRILRLTGDALSKFAEG